LSLDTIAPVMIRPASQGDVEAILHVINISNAESYREIIPAEYFKEPVLSRTELIEHLTRMEFYVYQEDDMVVGVSALSRRDEATGELRWVYVLPGHQRKGVGTALIESLEKKAREKGLCEMMLFTDENAVWAIKFYEKLGYRREGKRKLPWGFDVMMKKQMECGNPKEVVNDVDFTRLS
jgi:N-acetylglutamate synthase-like GNAT family acetyltransferase